MEIDKSEQDGQFYWRIKDNNHKIIGVGGEGFTTKQHASVSLDNLVHEIVQDGLGSDQFVIFRKEHWDTATHRLQMMMLAGESQQAVQEFLASMKGAQL